MSRTSTALVPMPSTAVGPSTPASTKTATPSVPYQPSPGNFKHPQLTEIVARQSRSQFTTRNAQNIVANAVALGVTFMVGSWVEEFCKYLYSMLPLLSSLSAPHWPLWTLRILFLTNIVLSFRPVIPNVPYITRKDDVTDIPLTPTQRQLLGLKPLPSPAAGSTGFVTPPRYRRHSGTSTPSSYQASTDRRSISANYFSSPLSTSRHTLGFSPSPQQANSSRSYNQGPDSPFSPSPRGSPLFYKAVAKNSTSSDFDVSRSSFNTSTTSAFGLSRSQSVREGRASEFDSSYNPGTPSPTGRKAASGLKNYKWLYEKGSKIPRSESMGF